MARMITFEDKDARALLDQLKLARIDLPVLFRDETLKTLDGLPQSVRADLLSSFHGKFHYVVCSWLQEQGANIIK